MSDIILFSEAEHCEADLAFNDFEFRLYFVKLILYSVGDILKKDNKNRE